MNSDFDELLKTFNDSEIKYLIVGGHAVMLYTEPRYTKELDVWVEASAENADRVFRALTSFSAPLAGLSPADFAREGFFYRWECLRAGLISSCPSTGSRSVRPDPIAPRRNSDRSPRGLSAVPTCSKTSALPAVTSICTTLISWPDAS